MPENYPETDYEVDTRDNTVFRKGRGMKGHALKPSDQLRLIYQTGTTDPDEPYNAEAFRGEDPDQNYLDDKHKRASKVRDELI